MKSIYKQTIFSLFIVILFSAAANASNQPIHKVKIKTVYHSDEDSIRTVVTKFFKALDSKDFKEARKYTVKDNAEFFEMMERFSQDPNAKKGPVPTIKEIKVNGETATVTLSVPQPMKLEKENGFWRIDVRMKPLPK